MDSPTDSPRHGEGLFAAEEAVELLRDALRAVDVTLPSLSVDLLSCTGDVGPAPLVALGRCNLVTAHELAAVLRRCPR
ncbi:hypothetical protein LHJ74_09710 [Streptomyces sp. N2-109]|uniref:Uncharacterized protein n=1 Tax=Streptomyces gossypii TaxID=2883101 RepID=A0ABT2JSE7_9ACTN|nr:hypothetical protein [Streptomyces gossypii]MCT2590184.1 hypothetical protein [Streptomyces gossypii]